jgi:hypothetical protein
MNETGEVELFPPVERADADVAAGSEPLVMTKNQYNHNKAIFNKAARVFAGQIDTLVFLHHAGYSQAHRRTLFTEYKPFGCPVSSACRVEASFAPSEQFLKDRWLDAGMIQPKKPVSGIAYDGTPSPSSSSKPAQVLLSECSCTFSHIC